MNRTWKDHELVEGTRTLLTSGLTYRNVSSLQNFVICRVVDSQSELFFFFQGTADPDRALVVARLV